MKYSLFMSTDICIKWFTVDDKTVAICHVIFLIIKNAIEEKQGRERKILLLASGVDAFLLSLS